MKKKNVTLYYGLIMATYSIGYLTMSAFSSLYLLDIGLSNGAIGALLAIASMISVLIQPSVGTLIDKNPKVSTKLALMVMSIIVTALGSILVFVPGIGTTCSTVIYGINVMLLMLAQPFFNALGVDAINYGYTIHFNIGRGMGSLGYALGSAAFGYISVLGGARSVPVAFSLAFLVLCMLLFIYPVKKVIPQTEDAGTKKKAVMEAPMEKRENSFSFLAKYRKFTVMLVGLILVYFSHALINTYALQIVTMRKGSSSHMGTASSIAAICELITTLLFPLYMKHFRLHKMIKVSCVFFTLKIFFSFLVTDMVGFYLIQGFQMFGWGIMTIGIILYVNNLVGKNDKARGQAFAGMSYTVASVLASLFGGMIIDAFGVNVMLIVGTVLAAIGTIVVWGTAHEITY